MIVVGDHPDVEAALKEMTDAGMTFVETTSVSAVQSAHTQRHILDPTVYEQMKVVRHQGVSQTSPVPLARDKAEQSDEMHVI